MKHFAPSYILFCVALPFVRALITDATERFCAEGWSLLNDGKCIQLLINPLRAPLLLTYPDARDFCQRQHEDSSLVAAHSKDELTALDGLLLRPNNQLLHGSAIWVAEEQPRRMYEFRSIDNEDLTNITNILRGSATDRNNGTTDLNRNCVKMLLGMRRDLALSWRAEPCLSRLPVVCERPPLMSSTLQSVQQIQLTIENSKTELSQTKLEVEQLARNFAELKRIIQQTRAELDELNENLKGSETQILSNTLEIAKMKFNYIPAEEQKASVVTGSETFVSSVDTNNADGERDPAIPAGLEIQSAVSADKEELLPSVATSDPSDISKASSLDAAVSNLTSEATASHATLMEPSPINSPQKSLKCPPPFLPPIGFVYTQYPGQLAPSALWVFAKWTEITSQYAGLFFRAEGDESSPFGIIQNGSCPRLASVQTVRKDGLFENIKVTPGEVSLAVTSGMQYLGYWPHWAGLKFEQSGGEVRPRNMAVKLFKRVA